jgi:hypothetical protein
MAYTEPLLGPAIDATGAGLATVIVWLTALEKLPAQSLAFQVLVRV